MVFFCSQWEDRRHKTTLWCINHVTCQPTLSHLIHIYIYILFIYLFIQSFIYFGCTGFSLLCELFSSFSEQDDSLGVVPGFLIAVASLAVKQELWSVGSIAVGHGLSCPRHVEYSRFSSVQLLICV